MIEGSEIMSKMTLSQLISKLEKLEDCAGYTRPARMQLFQDCTNLLNEYVKERTSISREELTLFDRYCSNFSRQYLGYSCRSKKASITAEYYQVCRSYMTCVEKWEHSKMLYLQTTSSNGKVTYEPLSIRVPAKNEHAVSYYLRGFEVFDSFERRYAIFKFWFFNVLTEKYSIRTSNTGCRFITTENWRQVQHNAKTMLDMLLAESREFYTENGYLEAKKNIAEATKELEARIEKLTVEEKEIAYEVKIDGRWIKLV